MKHRALLALCSAALLCACSEQESKPAAAPKQVVYQLQDAEAFCGENAYRHCHDLCNLGPRLSGSAAYEQQLQYLTKYLEQYGWTVTRQAFTPPHGVPMTNLHAVYGGGTETKPVLLTCHIDTKAGIADDFVSADDGASGAAVLLECARMLAKEPELAQQIELVFFDGEEAVAPRMTEEDGLYGSKYDVQRRGEQLPEYQINLDMVGARNKTIAVPFFDADEELLRIYEVTVQELKLNPVRWTITDEQYWDDDRPYREAGVATINLITLFVDSIWWHTTRDNMSRICPKSLQESGLVALTMLRRLINGIQQ